MAKQKEQQTKPRYKYFCHNCKEKFDSSEILHECKCGCAWLTVSDRDELTSGYFVEGVRQ